MKAIILAAGKSSRLGKYTASQHKCLLKIGGLSILERQIRAFKRAGIEDIIVVKGFAAEKIDSIDARYYISNDYDKTNMVYSLFCAEPDMQGDLVICYGDILFEDVVLQTLLRTSHDVSVVVDTIWEEYYSERYENPYEDAESLVCDSEGRIIRIGDSHPNPKDVQAQYIGLIKLSSAGSDIFKQKYHVGKEKYWGKPWIRGRSFQMIYMTDFLQALIDDGIAVHSAPIL